MPLSSNLLRIWMNGWLCQWSPPQLPLRLIKPQPPALRPRLHFVLPCCTICQTRCTVALRPRPRWLAALHWLSHCSCSHTFPAHPPSHLPLFLFCCSLSLSTTRSRKRKASAKPTTSQTFMARPTSPSSTAPLQTAAPPPPATATPYKVNG